MHLIGFLFIGIVAGWLAGKITRGRGYGLAGDLIFVVGALLGGAVLHVLGVVLGGFVRPLLVALFGALAVIFAGRVFKHQAGGPTR